MGRATSTLERQRRKLISARIIGRASNAAEVFWFARTVGLRSDGLKRGHEQLVHHALG